jgi:hypothetical protein
MRKNAERFLEIVTNFLNQNLIENIENNIGI